MAGQVAEGPCLKGAVVTGLHHRAPAAADAQTGAGGDVLEGEPLQPPVGRTGGGDMRRVRGVRGGGGNLLFGKGNLVGQSEVCMT